MYFCPRLICIHESRDRSTMHAFWYCIVFLIQSWYTKGENTRLLEYNKHDGNSRWRHHILIHFINFKFVCIDFILFILLVDLFYFKVQFSSHLDRRTDCHSTSEGCQRWRRSQSRGRRRNSSSPAHRRGTWKRYTMIIHGAGNVRKKRKKHAEVVTEVFSCDVRWRASRLALRNNQLNGMETR